MIVNVTKHDIKKGLASDPESCPIARAIRRATRYRTSPEVGGTEVTIRGVDYRLPKKATRFIHQFDSGIVVKPFTFAIKAKGSK